MMFSIIAATTIAAAAYNAGRNKKQHEERWYRNSYLLAAKESEAWWHSKIQDAIDALGTGYHAPVKRVLVTNKEARDVRIRFLSMLPSIENDGKRYDTVTLVKGEKFPVNGVTLNLNYEFGFKMYNGVPIPVAKISCWELDGIYSSYEELYNAAVVAQNKAAQAMRLIPEREKKDEIEKQVTELLDRRERLNKLDNASPREIRRSDIDAAEEDLSKSIEWE